MGIGHASGCINTPFVSATLDSSAVLALPLVKDTRLGDEGSSTTSENPANSLCKALCPWDFRLKSILDLIKRPAFSFGHELGAHDSSEQRTSAEQEISAEAA